MLTRDEQRELLRFAREAIRSELLGQPPVNSSSLHPNLLKPSGAFVTIRVNGELRGCIGYVEPTLPLAEVIADVAVKAATQDFRFEPLSLATLNSSTISISVLTLPQRISSIREILVGTHGVILLQGMKKGLLLPEVAVEHGWTCEEFVEGVTWKAGLSPGAWRDEGTTLSVFTTDVFHEEQTPEQQV